MKKSIVLEIICFLLILLFVYTAVSKFINFDNFRNFVVTQTPLSRPIAGFMAIAIPATELIASCLLLIPRFRKTGLYTSFVLMAVFTGYVVYALYFSPKVPCACGGIIRQMSWREHLLFNSVFTIAAFIAIRLYNNKANSDTKELGEVQFS
jgi:uncharacterized membrane protein YphA (DoxX/SURF4 family)